MSQRLRPLWTGSSGQAQGGPGERWRALASAGERWRALASAGERWRALASAGESVTIAPAGPDWSTALAAETAAIRGYGQPTTPRAGKNDGPRPASHNERDARVAADQAPAQQQVLVHAAQGLHLARAA